MNEEAEDREAPRLQDTSERSTLPLPLPGNGETPAAAASMPETGGPETPPYQPSPDVAGISDSGGGGASGRPELLVAGAFAGGVALAFLIKRLGS